MSNIIHDLVPKSCLKARNLTGNMKKAKGLKKHNKLNKSFYSRCSKYSFILKSIYYYLNLTQDYQIIFFLQNKTCSGLK